MARYESRAKKGYYKTPAHLLPMIGRYLTCDAPEGIRILDPCAGEGEAIEAIGLSLGLSRQQIYANELDEPRSDVCRKRDLVTVCGDAVAELQAPRGGFQLLFVNPPYDQEGDGRGRTEFKFLSTLRFLAQGGVLIYVVPLGILHSSFFVQRMSATFHSIRVLRFPDNDYATYGQCVLFAIYGRGNAASETQQILKDVSTPPILGDENCEPWTVPAPSSALQALKSFTVYSHHLTDTLITMLLTSTTAQKECATGLKYRVERLSRSLMPLRAGHQAVTLATGLMDGLYRDPESGNMLVIAGKTEIIEKKLNELDDEGRGVTRIRKTPQAVVKAFDITASRDADENILYDMR